MAGRFYALLIATCLLAAGCAQKGAQSAESATAAPAGTTVGNTGRGGQIFRTNCAVCHSTSGGSGVGPSLEHESKRRNYEQTVAWIMQPDPPMPKLYPSPLSEKDVRDVAAYVQSL
jgi:mono/diheme cytochrome c family protein